MSAVSALLAEAEASGVRLRVGEGGALRASGRVPPALLARLRERKAELVALLGAGTCRHCGGRLDAELTGALAFDDKSTAHVACYERAETERAGPHASRPHLPAGDRRWT